MMNERARLVVKDHPENGPDASKVAAPEAGASDPNDKEKPIKALDFSVPDKISKYIIGEKLGSGTCGIVFKAQDEVLNRVVAIKISQIGTPEASTGKVPGAQRAFITEISAAGRLKHPNIVTVYDAGQEADLNFLVMEAVSGYSLKAVGKGQKLLPPHRAIEVIIECCKALDYSHAHGVVHRDIKPANIMVGKDDSVKLLDFGIAVSTSIEDDFGSTGPTLGTPNYMSPEQIRGKLIGPASDFYSLGTVLFELLTGKQLFKAKKVKDLFRIVVSEIAPRLSEIRPDLPIELSEIIARMLHKLPEQRYQSGEELIDELSPIAEQLRIMAKRTEQQKKFIEKLSRLSCFKGFDVSEIAVFLNHAEQKSFLAGDLLIDEGEPTRNYYVITQGVAVVRRNGSVVNVLGEGDSFGEYGFIYDDLSPEQVSSLTGVNVLEVKPEFLTQLNPGIHLHYYKSISESLVQKMANAEQVVLDLVI